MPAEKKPSFLAYTGKYGLLRFFPVFLLLTATFELARGKEVLSTSFLLHEASGAFVAAIVFSALSWAKENAQSGSREH